MHRARWGPLVTNPASKPADLDVVVYENAWSSLSLLALALVVFARIAFLKNQRHLSLTPARSRVLEQNRAVLGAGMDFLCSEPRTVWACVSPSTGPEARQRFTPFFTMQTTATRCQYACNRYALELHPEVRPPLANSRVLLS